MSTTTPRSRLSRRDQLAVVEAYEGRCALCSRPFVPGDRIEFDHIRPLELAGGNERSNWQPLCTACHGAKTAEDHKRAAKAKRQKAAALGLRKSSKPLPCGKDSPWRKRLDGTVERRWP